MKKILSTLLAAALLLTLLTGCGGAAKSAEPKTFEETDLSVTLTDDFSKQELENITYYYISEKAIAMMLKEDFSVFEAAEISTDITLEQYAQLITDNNGLTGTAIGTDSRGNVSFTYTNTADGQEFFYYATVKKGTNAYWLCQFACRTADAEAYKPLFAEWGASIAVK